MTEAKSGPLSGWLRPLFYLGRNRVSQIGVGLTTSAAVTLVGFWLFETMNSKPVHPYSGIVFILVLPFFFLLGLLLIPVGIFFERRRLRREGTLPAEYPKIDLADASLRRAIILVAGLTILNVVILSLSAYMGVEYMDSSRFCGLTCHTVMAPEYTAYLDSPHSRIACASCHIGPGASWVVKAKIDGVRQVLAVTFGTYARPIPSPVHTLRPARATCEQCHWPQKFTGDRLKIISKFGDDEKNSPTKTVLLLKLGGRAGTRSVGIHGRHFDDKERISYVSASPRREVIDSVTYIGDDGNSVEYVSTEAPKDPKAAGNGTRAVPAATKAERRTMDCIDCHNRPTHAFQLPERAVNEAMAADRISPDLPFIHKKSLELLKMTYATREEAFQRMDKDLTEYYKAKYPDVYQARRPAVEAAVSEVKKIYGRNVWPNMKITWGTHPNHLGHEDFPGCFRCHDGSHKAADGRVISAECDACHSVLALDEANPKVLAELGAK
ncbi:MAG: NapC/NirT family cytochrome c [Acidobacteriota bacterium]